MARLITGYRVGRLGQLAIGCSATVLDETKQKMLLIRRTDNGRWAVPGFFTAAEMLHLDIADFDQQRIKDGFAAQPLPLIR